jgi:hypothetical protein
MSFGSRKSAPSAAAKPKPSSLNSKIGAGRKNPTAPATLSERIGDTVPNDGPAGEDMLELLNGVLRPRRDVLLFPVEPSTASLVQDPLEVAAGWAVPFAMPSSTISALQDPSTGRSLMDNEISGSSNADERYTRAGVFGEDMVRTVVELSMRAQQHRAMLSLPITGDESNVAHVDVTGSEPWRKPTVEVFRAPPVTPVVFTAGVRCSIATDQDAPPSRQAERRTADIVASAAAVRTGQLNSLGVHPPVSPFRRPIHPPGTATLSSSSSRTNEVVANNIASPPASDELSAKPKSGPNRSVSRADGSQKNRGEGSVRKETEASVPDKQAYVSRILSANEKKLVLAAARTAAAAASMGSTSSVRDVSLGSTFRHESQLKPSQLTVDAVSDAPAVATIHNGTSLFSPGVSGAREESSRPRQSPSVGRLSDHPVGGRRSVREDSPQAASHQHQSSLLLQHKLAATVERLADEVSSIKRQTKTIHQQLVEQQLREQAGFTDGGAHQQPLAGMPPLAAPPAQPTSSREEFFARMDSRDDAVVVSGVTSARQDEGTVMSTVQSTISPRSLSLSHEVGDHTHQTIVIPRAPPLEVIRLQNFTGKSVSVGAAALLPGDRTPQLTLAELAEGAVEGTMQRAIDEEALRVSSFVRPAVPSQAELFAARQSSLELLSSVAAFVRDGERKSIKNIVPSSLRAKADVIGKNMAGGY